MRLRLEINRKSWAFRPIGTRGWWAMVALAILLIPSVGFAALFYSVRKLSVFASTGPVQSVSFVSSVILAGSSPGCAFIAPDAGKDTKLDAAINMVPGDKCIFQLNYLAAASNTKDVYTGKILTDGSPDFAANFEIVAQTACGSTIAPGASKAVLGTWQLAAGASPDVTATTFPLQISFPLTPPTC